MPLPLISAATAAVLLLLQLILMVLVGLRRGRAGVFVGEGEDPHLLRRIRRHGNLAENAGLFIAALTLLELIGAEPRVVALLASAFVVARICHAIAFSSLTGSHGEPGSRLFVGARIVGAFGTLLTGLATVVQLLLTVSRQFDSL